MKKTFVLMTALAVSCATVKAQKTSFGIKAGVQQNTISMKQEEGGDWSRFISSGAGFHVGGLADISLTKNISVQPALLFNSKSAAMSSEVSFKLYALDVPVNFLYKTGGFFLGLGPNLSYGLSAKLANGENDENLYKKYPVGEGDEEKTILKRFEVGANVTMGYQFKNNLLISTNYTQGLSNLSNIESELGKMRTRFVGLSIGYILGK
ncbi:MAG: PorT family protein [Chitinophagaceae bacterium]|nr:PorT family protein [Chitinophagaceae bacterium]